MQTPKSLETLSPCQLRAMLLAAAADSLDGLQSLSGTAHHGGVRVFHQNSEIARVRVSVDEDGACVPVPEPEQSIVLTPAADTLC